VSVRLYGRDVGHGSLAVVTRGFREALEGAGLLEGVVALDRAGGSEESEEPPGALARDAVFTGNLNLVRRMSQGARHARHWVTVTPNSTYIPKDLLGAVVALPSPHILSASSWGTVQIRLTLHEMGFVQKASLHFGAQPEPLWVELQHQDKSVMVHTVHHGVSGFAPIEAELLQARLDYQRGLFRVVHFSTTDGERKGTLELVQAWALLRKLARWPESGELLLVLDDHARRALQERMLDRDLALPVGVRILPRGNLSSLQMSNLLCHMHVLAAPSRGEGFGLTVAEARACGIVTVSTRTTGHSAGHCDGPGTIQVHQQDRDLCAIDDGPGALAPSLQPAHIATALMTAFEHWEKLSAEALGCAEAFRQEWSWQQQLAPLVELLR